MNKAWKQVENTASQSIHLLSIKKTQVGITKNQNKWEKKSQL